MIISICKEIKLWLIYFLVRDIADEINLFFKRTIPPTRLLGIEHFFLHKLSPSKEHFFSSPSFTNEFNKKKK